jgi:HPt (histidine-containing phosphotransfer) domain-containing protein
MALNIKGVDEDTFNSLFDGDEALFASVLETFIEKTPSVLGKLASVSKETLHDYATTVHGFKGACANICAEEARKKALKLETMSKDGDLSGVLAENGSFLKYVEDLMGNLQNWIRNH